MNPEPASPSSKSPATVPPATWPMRLASLAVCILICFAAAAMGGMASAGSGAFYAQLRLPTWAPPGWLFGPVWTLLYLMMAVALWIVWQKRREPGAKLALGLFAAQLGANALWTWLFFAWRLGAAAFVEIVLLWILILLTLITFGRINRLAGLLLAPYLAWVSFAAVLCLVIWRMNPQLLG